MACPGCGKSRAKKASTVVIPESAGGYSEGQDGYVKIVYSGTVSIDVGGKCTGHYYRFAPLTTRMVDKCDADWFVNHTKFFSFVQQTKTELMRVDNAPPESDNATEESL